MSGPSLGFFTRVLDDVRPGERYELALAQICGAEALGFDSAVVAQHHLRADEGGLPSPLVFLAHAAAHTQRIRLGTGVITLALEDPLRVAEDATVTDLLSGGRLELGFASGGSPASFASFGIDFTQRHEVFAQKLDRLTAALQGEELDASGARLYPPADGLADRIWLATFSEPLAVLAGRRGHGLMLSRTQPRNPERPQESLADIQNRLIDAYLEHLPGGVGPRISVARTVFVADDREYAHRLALAGHRRSDFARSALGELLRTGTSQQVLAAVDAHVGEPEDVSASLVADSAVARATHLSFQVHSVDPPHESVLRSNELIASQVAPSLGWTGPAEPDRSTR